MLRTRIVALLGLLAVAGSSAASTPTIESVSPAIGRRGTEFTVVLTGGRLADAAELLMPRGGLACRSLKVVSDNEVRATLAAEADCPVGAYPFRLRTPGGVSEWRVVHVTDRPVVVETARAGEAPQPIPRSCAVAGILDAGEVDAYAVEVGAGERLAVEVQAVRLGGEMTDAVLAIEGPDGRELARVDDTAMTRQDPFASLIAPASGRYTIRVRETSRGGGPNATYALHIGSFPRPTTIFPAGGQAGTTRRITLVEGPDRATRTVDVSLPADAGPWWDFFPTIDGEAAPTPTPFRVRPYPSVDEDDPSSGMARDWPVAFHGVIKAPGEVDTFAIRAEAGEAIQVEVFADRIGSPLDPILEVLGPDGSLVARADDDPSLDGRLTFTAREAGDYRLAVRDKRRESSPGHVYRIEAERPTAGLALFVPGPVRKSQARQAIAVPRGNRVLAHVGVRRDGFDAPVRVATGALPDGVTIDMAPILAGEYLAPVVVEARPDAPLGAKLVELIGTAETPAGTIRGGLAQVVDLVPGSGDSSYQSITVDRLAIVVVEAAPYRVELEPPRAALAQDGAVDVVARVARSADFDGAIEVALPYLPPGVEMDGPATIAEGADSAVLRLFARPDAAPTAWRLAAEARPAPPRRDRVMAAAAPGGRRRANTEGLPTVASGFAGLDLARPPIVGKLAPVAAEQGATVRLVCEFDGPIAAPMTATIEGLPPRAEAAPATVAPGDRRVEFVVTIAATTPIGDHEGLACRLDGEAVAYRIGRGGRLTVRAPGTAAQDETGRPLSPLDALRRERRAAKP